MTSSIINYIVEKYLANILEINTENTKSSLFSGTAEMNNLKIKPEIFEQVNIPYFELVDGYVGSLKIQMSLPRFYKYPIKIIIDKVFFHARQRSLNKLKDKEEIQAMENYKQSKLNSLEELTSQVTELSAEEPGMAQQIVNNLQIEIGEILFKFDDDISMPGNPFVFGLILKKILIKTTTDKYEEKASSDNIPFGEVNHKLVKVQGMSLFLDFSDKKGMKERVREEERSNVSKDLAKYLQGSLDFYLYCMSELNYHSRDADSHHYLLYDLTTSIQLATNENIKANGLPKLSCNLLIDNLLLNLDLKQLTIMFKLMAYLNLNNLYRVGIYKQFYNKEVALEFKTQYMLKYIDYYKYKYVKKYLSPPKADEIKKELLAMEAGLTYDQVQSMREASKIKIDYLFNMENIDAKIAEIKGKWRITSYFSSGVDEANLKLLQGEKDKLLGDEEKYNQLIREQLEKEKGIELDMYKGLPDDYVLNNFNMELKKCVMSIGELDCRKLIDFVFTDFEVKVLLGLTFQNIFLYLDDFCVDQYKFKHPFFNKIIESYEDEGKIKDTSKERTGLHKGFHNIEEITAAYSQRKGAMYIEFENNPANELSNYRFKLRNEKRLYIYANIYVLQYASTKILDSLKSNIDLQEIQNYAKGEVQKYIEEGYVDKIFSGEYSHFNIETDIILKGPVVVLPQNIHDLKNTSCMLLSLGEFQITSQLPKRMDPKINYITLDDPDQLYDRYFLKTEGFQLSTMGDFTSIAAIFSSKSKLDIIENVNIEIQIANLIEPKNECLENLTVDIKILNTILYLRDIQIEYMIYFLDAFNKINKLLAKELDVNKSDYAKEKISKGVLEEAIEKSKDVEERRLLLGDERELSISLKKGESKLRNFSKVVKTQIQANKASVAFSQLNKKEKIFFKMEFALKRVQFIIMKSLTREEAVLFQADSDVLKSPFKSYLNFVMNNFTFNSSVTDRKDSKANLKIQNMFFFDEDFNYKAGSPPQQDLLVNPEFQCIMGSINEEQDVDTGNNMSRSVSFCNEAKDNPYSRLQEKTKSFIEFNYSYFAFKNKSEIKVNFTKLLICLNLSTFTRLSLFGKCFGDLYKKVNRKQKRDLLSQLSFNRELEELKELKETKRAAQGGSKGINQKFFKNVINKMEMRKGNTSVILANPANLNESIIKKSSVFPSIKEEPTYSTKEKSQMKFSFEMKEIELNFPLHHNSDNTKVLKLNFNMMVKLKQLTEYESFFTLLENKLIKQNYYKNSMNLNLMIFNVDLDIINFRNGHFIKSLLEDKILSNSRVTCSIKSFLILEKESSVTNLDLHVEPISMIMGFRQLKVLSNYGKAISEFSADLTKSMSGQIDRSNSYRSYNSSYDSNYESNEKSKFLGQYKSQLDKKIKEANEKIETQIKYNTANFNSLIDVNFKLDKAVIKLIDNTGYNNIPLTKIECSKISFKFISNSDPNDSHNMAQALVEMISRKEVTQYNIYNLYLYLDACYNVEIAFYNEKVSDWEPIMEPWNAQVKLSQVIKLTRLKVDFTSDVMLNLNLSFYSVQVFNKIMKRLSQEEHEWVEEEKTQSGKGLVEYGKQKKKTISKDNEISLEFINSTGVDFSFWFDADVAKKFNLKTGEKKYFTKSELSLIYKALTDSERIMARKDKFSFTLLECDPVEAIDFSYNHYPNLRIPLGKSLMDPQNEFNFFEVTVKIKNTGLIKTIVVESNLTIQNNTQYKIGLHVMKTNDMVKKYTGSEENKESDQNKEREENKETEVNKEIEENKNNFNKVVNFDQSGVDTIEPFAFIKVPLNWMTQPHMMLARIIDDDDKMKGYKLFYEELNFVYRFGDEYQNQMKNFKEDEGKEVKDKIMSTFTEKYSKLIPFEFESKQVNLSLDLMLLKSSSVPTPQILSEDKNRQIKETFSYSLLINPPLVIENQIPYNLSFSYGRNDSTEVTNLLPLQKFPIFYVNYQDNRTDLKLQLDYFKSMSFESEFFSFLDDVEENKKMIKLLNKNNHKDYYEAVIKYSPSESLTIFNKNYTKLERSFSKSKKMTFFMEYLIVSKFDLRLFIKSNKSSDDEINVSEFTNNTIYEHKVNLFNLPPKEEKARIKSEVSEWSNAFQINTHGVDGVVTIETKLDKDKDLLKENKSNNAVIMTDIGMIISSSSFFNHSTVVILEPRYLLVNDLGIEVNYRQMITKELPSNERIPLADKEAKVLAFNKAAGVKKVLKYLQFIINTKSDSDFPSLDENWSPTSNIDSLDDFDIKLPIPNDQVESLKLTYGNNVFSYDSANYFLLARVVVHSTDNVLIYIVLTVPKIPQFVIRNDTDQVLVLKQKDAEKKGTSTGIVKVLPKSEVPFTWFDLLLEKKKVVVGVKNKEINFSFENIEKLKQLKLFDDQLKILYFSILTENKNTTRVLKVEMEDKSEENSAVKAVKQMLKGKQTNRILKVNVSLKGLGLSIIDETPKEVFYISFYCLDVRYVNNISKSQHTHDNTENVEVYIKNFQIDYCLEDSFKLIIYPKNQILPSNEKDLDPSNIVPFMMLLVTRKTIQNLQTDNVTTKISQIDFSMQEINVKIDQFVLNTLLGLVNSFLSVMNFYKVNPAVKDYKSNQIVDKNKLCLPAEYCPTLSTEIESYEKIVMMNDDTNMIFIEALMLAGLKINLTLRIDISTLEISLVPGFIIKVLGTLGNALARITDSPLRFSELILQNCFTDSSKLVAMLQKHYVKQGVIQFYKIIGSSDLIGNPIGLVDRLGTGFIEFFNEPRKGFLQGPKQFGEGVAKGLNSLVSNVIGGGFDTVGKITGTLLAATKNLQGEKLNQREEDEPDNLFSGAYEGVKGGITEIGKGLVGIFMNPYKSAKTEGVKGFFKGVGTGILGALISPFSAVLKVGNSLAVGLKNTATYFSRGKFKTVRFRHPRHIIVNEPLKPYDENFAEVQAIIRNLGGISDNKLIFFSDFKYIDQDLDDDISTLIVTDKRITVIYKVKEKVFELDINSVRRTEVHIVSGNFILVFFLNDGSKKFIRTEEVALCCQVHGILQKIISKPN